MKRSLIYLCLSFLTACSSPQNLTKQITVDPAFKSYVGNFESMASKEGHPVNIDNLVVMLDTTMAGPAAGSSWILGTCTMGDVPTVRINSIFWNGGYLVSDKEQLLFHELGHCILNRVHDSSVVWATDSPGYILDSTTMNPFHMSAQFYNVNHDYYMKELFGVKELPSLHVWGASQFDGTPYAGASTSMPSVSEPNPKYRRKGETNVTRAQGVQYDENGTPNLDGILCND